MSTIDRIPPSQLEKANTLHALSWRFSGKPQGNLTIAHYNTLAKCIEDEIECTIVGKSIKNFSNSLKDGTLRGFKQNTTKETLAGYVLVKAGVIDEVEVLRNPHKGYNHPVRKYWIMYEEHYEQIKALLPADAQLPAVTIETNYSVAESFFLKPILSYFQNTVWMIYTRARTGGIYRHVLRIGAEKSGYLNKVSMKNGSTQVEDYIGEVGMDASQGYLIFDLVTRESRLKHLHIKLKVGRGALPRVAIGQSNFISTFRDQIMTDAVVFMLAPNTPDAEAAATCFLPDTPAYLGLSPGIRRYLYMQHKCRLIAPRTDIINSHQLTEWLENQRMTKEPSTLDPVLLRLCDTYSAFYLTPAGRLEERRFCIRFDRNVEEIRAVAATDCRDRLLNAEIFRRGNTVSLFQKEIAGRETHNAFLSFEIPFDKNPEVPWFAGFVCGGWQGLNGSGSRALVIPNAVPEFETRGKQWAVEYFGRNRERYRPKQPAFRISFRGLGLAFAAWLESRLAKPGLT